MNSQSILTLVQNAGILIAIAILGDLSSPRWDADKKGIGRIVLGAVTGALGIILMLTPMRLMSGVVFDTRSILLGISGLFFGPIPTLIAMAMTAALRLVQGGDGARMGVAVILVTGSAGILWRKLRRKRAADLGWPELYVFGLSLHVAMLACTVFLPSAIRGAVLGSIIAPVLLIYPAGTALLGRLLVNRLKRKEIADALAESEERLRLAMEVNEIGFFEHDLVTGRVHYSSEWKPRLDHHPADLPDSPDAWESRIHPDDKAAVLAKEREWWAGQSPEYEAEFRFRHLDGSWRWLLARGHLVTDDKGRPIKAAGCHIDITKRKQDEEAIRATERRFRSLAESSSDYIMLYDREGRHVYMNPAGMAAAGFTESDIIGKTHQQANYGAHASEYRKSDIEAVFETGRPSTRLIRWEKPEGTFYLDWRLSPVPGPDGNTELVLGISRDITALKRAEAELRKKEELFRALIENAPDGVTLINLEGEFIYVSPSARKMFSYEPDEPITARPVDSTHPDDLPSVLEALDQTIKNPGTVPAREYRFRKKNGEWLWIESRFSNLLDRPGVEAIVINFRDISAQKKSDAEVKSTHLELRRLLGEADESRKVLLSMVEDLKRSEEQIRRLNAELESRVRDRTAQLEAANRELESFAYSVSHDLRSPLRAIDGFSVALLREYRDRMDENGIHYLERITEGTRRMGQLINDLLGLSRVTRSEFARSVVDLSSLAAGILAGLAAGSPDRKVETRVQQGLCVQGDPSLLDIMLENLLGNAWKFTEKTPSPVVEFGAGFSDGRTVFFVRDNGVGFDMAYANKLFAPFQRLHRTDEFPGTGIGLVTVQRIVQRHGGKIWPEAAPGTGATFRFTLGNTV